MEPFTTLNAIAAPYDDADVDTDRLIPHRFLRKPLSAGYGNFLFHDERYCADGAENPAFVLNQAPYRAARILVTGSNFGCGSTREGAVYALCDYGIRAIIAPSFADIFRGNCIQNGILPVVLDESIVQGICWQLAAAPGTQLHIDLPDQYVMTPDANRHGFTIEPSTKMQLLQGLDEIGVTLGHRKDIAQFEAAYRSRLPWLAQ